MTTPATPRPWHAEFMLVVDDTGGPIAEVEDSLENADLIVRAVNAHDALLAALRALVDNAGHYSVPGFVAAIEQARALLRDLSPEEEGQ